MRRALLLALAMLAACERGGAAPAPQQPAAAAAKATPACAADELGPLDRRKLYRDCANAADECRAACDRDDVEACFGLASELEQAGDVPASSALYRKACLLGAPNACTNHAAQLWAFASGDADLVCAQRLFEASCEHDDPFGCGMAGRLLIDGAEGPDDEDVSRGRAILERSCIQLGGFSCRILALQLERGRLGAVPEARIPALMQQACEGGDTSACGEHATVEDSFEP